MSISGPTVSERSAAAKRAPKYPGIRTAADGAEAVVWVEKHLSQAACVHALPPASRMAERFAREVEKGRRNLWDEALAFKYAESAYAAASMCEGFTLAGGRATTFTGGQGLLQMAEVLLTAAGQRLPMVFHVAAGSLASQAITMQAGHDDVCAVADCGWGILIARNAQEAADLALIARRAAELAETPFLNVQDGFITTHGLETVYLPEPELMKVFAGAPDRRVRKLFNPDQPLTITPLENQDSYMRGRLAQRFFCERVRPSLDTAMADFAELTGRRYGQVRCNRMEDAEYAIVGMGSMMDTAEGAIEHLRAQGVRAGSVSITSLRPFPATDLVNAVARCRAVTVIERTDTPLAGLNPLTRELKAALAAAQMGEDVRLMRVPQVCSGVAGVGGLAMGPATLVAAVENMRANGPRFFVLGIKHPDAIATGPEIETRPAGACTVRIHSRAGYGSTSTAKLIGSLASELFNLDVRVDAQYRGEQRVGPAGACITFASKRLHAVTDPPNVDIVAIQCAEAWATTDPLARLRDGGTLILDTELPFSKVWASLPGEARRSLRERNIDVFSFNGAAMAAQKELTDSRAGHRGMPLLGALLKILPWRDSTALTDSALFAAIGALLQRQFEQHDPGLWQDLAQVVRRGYQEVSLVVPPASTDGRPIEITRRPRNGNGVKPVADADLVPAGFCERVIRNYVDGHESVLDSDLYIARSLVPGGTANLRSFRQLSTLIPRFQSKDCSGCMECVNLCPDSAIFARVVEPETIEHVPPEIHSHFSFTPRFYEAYLKKGEAGGLFGLYIDPDRCKGCGECVDVCGERCALTLVNKSDTDLDLYDRARDFFERLPDTPERFINRKSPGDIMLSVRARLHTGGAGSCMGCGESSALRMLLAATGFVYGAEQMGIVATSGCHTAAVTSYPFSPVKVSWVNTLAANAPAAAMGIRAKWDAAGQTGRRLWVIGDESALMAEGRNALCSLIDSGLDINVLVLDKSSRNPVGNLGSGLLLSDDVLIAQTTPAHINHFHKSIIAANEYPGPAVVICYSACTADHGIADDQAAAAAKLAVDSRTFPLFVYDPRLGIRLRERLDLRGNPSLRDDWCKHPVTGEVVDFAAYARTQGRFASCPEERLKGYREAALSNWRRLQELGGLR